MLTIDEPIWQGRGEQFIKAIASGHFDKTLTGGQPGVMTTWIVGLSQPWKSLAAAQASNALATGILILITTYGLIRLWGFTWGVTGGFFLALDPFLVAHSRLVHTDALFALFALASLIFALLFREQGRATGNAPRQYLVLSAFLLAAALLTRSAGILLAPIVLVIIASAFLQPYRFRAGIQAIILWGAIAVLTVFALWPALWVSPEQVALYLTERTTLHVTSGTHAGETTAQWWYYARETLFRTTPVVLLGAILALPGIFRRRDTGSRTALILLTAGIFFAIIMSFSTDKSDRYILFSLLALDLFAVAGLQNIQKYFRAAPLVAIALLALEVVSLHPYYLAHYNRLYPVEDRHKLGWGEGLEQAAAWLENYDPGAKIVSYYPSVMKTWYSGPVDPLNHVEESNARYVVLYRSMFERGPGHVDTEIVAEYLDNPTRKPIHTIFINRLPYVWIFERE